MPEHTSTTRSELFIVDNSEEDWKVIRYLHAWCQISKSIDIATGGERYTVKRYESEKAQVGDSWHHKNDDEAGRLRLQADRPHWRRRGTAAGCHGVR